MDAAQLLAFLEVTSNLVRQVIRQAGELDAAQARIAELEAAAAATTEAQ